MYCKKCGEKYSEGSKFCTGCGISTNSKKILADSFLKKIKGIPVAHMTGIVILLIIAGSTFYSYINSESNGKTESGINKYTSGDTLGAIKDLTQAKDSAVGKSTKLATTRDLAYVQIADGNIQKALSYFKEALGYTSENSYDFYLVSGEIAEIEMKPNSALLNFKKAYDLQPNSGQANNSLNLFYLDLEDVRPNYVDYPQALFHAKKAQESGEIIDNTAFANLGLAYYWNDDYSTALTYFKKTNPQEPYVHFWMALSYAMLDDVDNMELYLQKSVDGGYTTWEEINELSSE